MKSKFTWIFTLLMAFCIQLTFAQEKTITGTVTDSQGLGLPGATVMIEGKAPGVQTDLDGKYSISAAPGQKLVFSFVGFTTQVIAVGNSSTIDVQLQEGRELENVVVDSYRTMSRPKNATAAATVTSKTIEGRPNASFVQTLQGQVPGLNIASGSGQPGSNNTTVILRGAGSINGNVEPLYVIDGVPQTGDNFRSINPADIESATVLKDAGATAIYGNRGANGVIVVKTKRGSYESKMSVKYTGITGFSEMQKNHYSNMNSQQLLTLQREYGAGSGAGAGVYNSTGVPMTDAQIAAAPNYNWKDYFYRTGVSQNHTLNISAGSKNLSSFTSIAFLDQEGILKGSDLKRFNFRSNLDGKSNDGKFTFATTFTANYSVSNTLTSLGTGGINQNFVIGPVMAVPYFTPGNYTSGYDLAFNNPISLELTPLYLMDKLRYFRNQSDEVKAIGQMKANYKITDDLSIGTQFGIDYVSTVGLTWQDPESFNSYYFSSEDQTGGFQTESYARNVSMTSTTNLTYTKRFGDHTIDFSAFTEYLKAHYKAFSATQNGLDPTFSYPGTGNGYIAFQSDNVYYVPEVGSSKYEAGLFSYFGSADYDYKDKFGLSATIRRDASYRFSGDNRWGTFYSIAGRWNIDKEAFMQNTVFNSLKLRGSYGTAGNQDVTGSGLYITQSLTKFNYGITSGYNNGQAYTLADLAQPNLQWETIAQLDFGLDFELFHNRLRGVFDVYEKRTKDLYQSIPISAVNGTTSLYGNFGSLYNRGVELQLGYDVVSTNDFVFTLNFNGSYNKNKVLDLVPDSGVIWDGESLSAIREGGLISEYYVIKYAGVNPANGNLLFYDKDGNLTENPTQSDRQWTNKSALPKYQGSFGFDVKYKGFFANAMFTYVQDIYRFDWDWSNLMDPTDVSLFNKSTELNNYWTPSNRETNVPGLYATNKSWDSYSDRFLVDASYVRLRYISVGYNFSKELLAKTPFSSIRAYGQAENLYTWTKWRGYDAESNRGADQSQYPTPKMFSLGLEVQF
ncbi:SusC/RagA family TonB-linked outer membrane protein [Flavobacterium sp. RHBU_3]|uniref:SusC/RagA family TonB-linked outer membrane protein n=1 Tax=Flavobacterium sp. RHBU_3 TaxID=3391184 RepID=UPI0039848E9D